MNWSFLLYTRLKVEQRMQLFGVCNFWSIPCFSMWRIDFFKSLLTEFYLVLSLVITPKTSISLLDYQISKNESWNTTTRFFVWICIYTSQQLVRVWERIKGIACWKTELCDVILQLNENLLLLLSMVIIGWFLDLSITVTLSVMQLKNRTMF